MQNGPSHFRLIKSTFKGTVKEKYKWVEAET